MFFLETNNKADCCGCKACENKCPVNSIHMVEDNEGFEYPIRYKEKCVNCNLCYEVCPISNNIKLNFSYNTKAYIAIHNNENVLINSSSGGVFSAIVTSLGKDDFIVYGVELDNNLKAVHTHESNIKGTEKYRKSKYIQSDLNEVYKQVEIFLKNKKKVLFTGTPCQVAGLKLFLDKDYGNFFCCDVVCHGVPSQKIFYRYLNDYLEIKYKGKVTSISFRHKTYSAYKEWNSRNIKAIINNKTVISSSDIDPYLRGYHSGLFYRPSCYNCKFAKKERVSDITMADFWGIEGLYPELDVHKGVSLLIANSKKGESIVQEIRFLMNIQEVDINFAIKGNMQLNKPSILHPKREQFFKYLETNNFDKAINACLTKPHLLKRFIKKALPKKTKSFIKKLIRRSEKLWKF